MLPLWTQHRKSSFAVFILLLGLVGAAPSEAAFIVGSAMLIMVYHQCQWHQPLHSIMSLVRHALAGQVLAISIYRVKHSQVITTASMPAKAHCAALIAPLFSLAVLRCRQLPRSQPLSLLLQPMQPGPLASLGRVSVALRVMNCRDASYTNLKMWQVQCQWRYAL